MRKIDRAEVLGLAAYEAVRDEVRGRLIARKKERRVAVGRHVTLVFENHDTALLQIQEMLRAERITDERAIAHEIATYDDLIPDAGELSATLFVEVDDKDERARMLDRLAGLGRHLSLRIGAERAPARFLVQAGEVEERLPAVNYVRFAVPEGARARLLDPSVRVAIEVTHPAYEAVADVPVPVRRELAADLG